MALFDVDSIFLALASSIQPESGSDSDDDWGEYVVCVNGGDLISKGLSATRSSLVASKKGWTSEWITGSAPHRLRYAMKISFQLCFVQRSRNSETHESSGSEVIT